MKKTALLFVAFALFNSPVHAEGDVAAGEKLFKRICGGCHQVGEGAQGSFGPQLNAIIGRHSASTSDYQYSEAMKSANLVWDQPTLTAYLEAPKKVVPGTRMIFWGLDDPEKLADLFAYLQTFQPQ